ncbi:MAG: DHA2 family efflux MFS transporter permease subunit [Marmoricola sp.]
MDSLFQKDRETDVWITHLPRRVERVSDQLLQDPPAPTGPKSSSSGEGLDRSVLIVAGVVVLGAIMSILDITVVSVALQTFQSVFEATSAQVAWTMTGYTLALASVIPLTGWAADRFGTKRLYMLALLLFALGSALCATAGNLETLVAWRVVQGLGGGMLMPLGMTILTRAAGPERVGRVMAVLGIPMLLGPIFGPILGGWLIDAASWHWIFLINVPIGAIAIVYAARVLPKDHVEPSESFDLVGMLLLSPGLASFLYGVSSIPAAGTIADARVLTWMLLGVVLIAAFVPWALRPGNTHPLVDLRLFGIRAMTVAVIAMALFAIAFFGASLLFPLYFQQVRHESALQSGLLLAPQGIGAMLTMPIAGVLADRIGPGKVVITGLVVDTIGMGLFTQLDAGTSYTYILASLFVMGLGMGATMMPIMSAALATLSDHTVARGSTLLNTSQQVASSVGTALFSVLLTNGIRGHGTAATYVGLQQQLAGVPADAAAGAKTKIAELAPVALRQLGNVYADVFVVATVLVGLCLVPALFLPRRKQQPVDPGVLVGH